MVWDTYEISLWTHSDRFVSVLAQSGSHYHKEGYTPVLEMNTNGEVKLSFTIPIVVYNKETGELEDNSLWYDQLKKEKTLANEKKVKCILNKGKTNDKGEYTHTIVETVITNMTERRDGLQLFCDVECSGLAFKWLGKIGYTITLDSDTVLLEEEASGKVIHPNINYWLDKVFPRNPDGSWATKWGYEIRMNYAGMGQSRDATKVYENDSIVSWTQSISGVTPVYNETPIEKERFLSVSESNKYNITQDIAELFEVFVRYEFLYEDPKNPYKITRGIAVFYNELVDFTEYTISFKDNETGLSKTTNSNDIVTKLYVRDIESENSDDGYISISNALNNITKDNFILDFDYYKQSGQMSDEQIAAIPQFETDIRAINIELENNITERNQLENAILDKEVEVSNINDKIISAQANSNDYTDKMSLLDSSLSTNRLTDEKVAYFTAEKGNRVCVNFNRSGVISGTITCQSSGVTLGEPILDTYGFVTGIYLNGIAAKKIVYLTYDYDLLSFYRNNIETYDSITTSLNAKLKVVQAELGDKDHPAAGTLYAKLQAAEDKYEELRERKQKITLDFENLMGFFLKEGYWSTTDYKAPSEAKQVSGRITYDAEPYVGEQLSYYTVGAAETKTYYNFVEAETLKNLNIEDLTIVERWSNLGVDYSKQYLYNAQYTPQFMNINGGPHYVLLFNEDVSLAAGHKLYYTVAGSKEVEITSLYRSGAIVANQHNLMYRRYTIPGSENPITSTIEVYNGGVQLEEFYDYLIQNDGGDRVITFKCNAKIGPALSSFTVKYKCDRTTTQFFYDAQDVAKRSAFPVVSYDVSFSYLKNTLNIKPNVYARDMYLFIYTPDRLLYLNDPNDWLFLYESSYKDIAANLNDSISLGLGSIVRINDHQLGFHGVKGIVTKFTLHLDEPWNSQFVIQNYKTRFEDLFGRIVASSEQMKNNVISYGRAAEAVLPTGEFISEFLQNTIDNNRLIYNSGITSGVTLDEYGITVETTYPYNDGVTGMLLLRGGAILMSDSLYDDGERRWTTGITPSGINATAITVGRLDTEKINIYSGNQVRFTWQADGLHAFGQNPDGSTDFTTYVNYNQDGLQFRTNNFMAVNLGWNGLYLGAQDGAVELTANDGLCVYNAPQGVAGRAKLVQLGKLSNGAVSLYGLKLFDYSGNETLVTDNTGKLWLRDTLIVGSTKNDMVGISGLNDADNPIRIWAGNADKNKAPFRVYQDGSISIGGQSSSDYVNGLVDTNTSVTNLQVSVDTLTGKIDAEITRATKQELALGTSIETEVENRKVAISASADEIRSQISSATVKYVTDKYNITLYGFTDPDKAGYLAGDHSGEYYLNQTNGAVYQSNGVSWTQVDTLELYVKNLESSISQTEKEIRSDVKATYETKEDATTTRENLQTSITQTAKEIRSDASSTISKYDAEGYIINLFGFDTPDKEGFIASQNNGQYYLDQSTGNLYRSNGSTWNLVKTLKLITENLKSSIIQTAEEIRSQVSSATSKYDTTGYNVTLFGFTDPTTAGFAANQNNGKYYLNQSNGALYYSNGSTWTQQVTLKLITANLKSYIDQTDTNIRTHVSETYETIVDSNEKIQNAKNYSDDQLDNYKVTVASDISQSADSIKLSVKNGYTGADGNWVNGTKTIESSIEVISNRISMITDGDIKMAAGKSITISSGNFKVMSGTTGANSTGFCVDTTSNPVLWIGDTDKTKAPFRVMNDGTVILTKLQRLTDETTGKTETIDLGRKITEVETRITQTATQITSIAGDVSELDGSLSGVRTELDGANKKITEQAGKISKQGELIEGVQLVLNGAEGEAGLVARMGDAESALTVASDEIKAEVKRATEKEGEMSASIKANADAIELRATKTEFDALGERVGTAETKITQNADAIELRATKKELDEVSASLKVESDKITSVVGDVNDINGTLGVWDTWISGIETNVISQRDAIQGVIKDVDTHNTLIYQNRDAIALCATKEGMAAAIKVEADRITSVVGDVNDINGTLGVWDTWISGIETNVISQRDAIQGVIKDVDTHNTLIYQNRDAIALCATKEGMAAAIKVEADRITSVVGDVNGISRDVYGYEDEEGVHHGGVIEGIWNAQTEITQTKEAITLKADADVVNKLTGRVEKAESQIEINANGITQTVKKGELISQINQSAEEVKISASKVNLVGYVTTDYLESKYITAEQVNADISEYVETWADDATFGTLSVVNGNITSLSCTDITIGGNGLPDAVQESIFSKPHYHTVTESGGTVTIGGPSATPGFFNIADTQFYKDGVLAAKNQVRVSGSWSSGVYTAKTDATYPHSTSTYISGTANATYDSTTHKYSISAPVMYSGGPGTPSSSTGYTISGATGTEAYTAGQNSVMLKDPVWRESAVYTNQAITVDATNGESKTAYVYLTQGSWSSGTKPVYLRSDSSSGTIRARVNVDMPETAVFSKPAKQSSTSTSVTFTINCIVGGKTYTSNKITVSI